MAFTIPDKGEGVSDYQSVIFEEHIRALVQGIGGGGVLSGCAVTAATGSDFNIAAGEVRLNGLDYTFAGGSSSIVSDPTNPRFHAVMVSTNGVSASLYITTGTPATPPKIVTEVSVVIPLAFIYVPAGATSISAANIVDARVFINAAAGRSGFKNKIINGNFGIWQRVTSLAAAVQTNAFLADRWAENSTGSTIAASQQAFTLGQADVPGEPTYFHRSVVSSVAGAANYAVLQQRIEGVRTFAGQTVTVSFYAKADVAIPMAIDLNQNFGTGGTPSAQVDSIGAQKFNLTTAWQKFTATITVPSIAGKTLGTNNNDFLELTFWFDAGTNFATRSATLGQQSGTFDISLVQIENGSVATPFEHRPFGTELALCQRYYWKGLPVLALNYPAYTADAVGSWIVAFPVQMRVTPTTESDFTGAALAGTNAPTWGQATVNGGRLLALSTAAAPNANISFAAGNCVSASAEH